MAAVPRAGAWKPPLRPTLLSRRLSTHRIRPSGDDAPIETRCVGWRDRVCGGCTDISPNRAALPAANLPDVTEPRIAAPTAARP